MYVCNTVAMPDMQSKWVFNANDALGISPWFTHSLLDEDIILRKKVSMTHWVFTKNFPIERMLTCHSGPGNCSLG